MNISNIHSPFIKQTTVNSDWTVSSINKAHTEKHPRNSIKLLTCCILFKNSHKKILKHKRDVILKVSHRINTSKMAFFDWSTQSIKLISTYEKVNIIWMTHSCIQCAMLVTTPIYICVIQVGWLIRDHSYIRWKLPTP